MENRGKLDQIARRLIEVETLEADDLQKVFNAPLDQQFPPAVEPNGEDKPKEEPKPEGQEGQEGQGAQAPKPGLAWGSDPTQT